MKRICWTALVFLGLTAALPAQVMKIADVPEQAAKPLAPGELTPYFWIGGQTVTVLGHNLETGATGLSYNTNDTWVSFNFSLVDSHYDTPKKIASQDDPGQWSLAFKLYDPTARINSYSSSPEVNYPAWTVGIQGFGWRFGALSAPNRSRNLNDGGDSTNNSESALNLLHGADEVLTLGQLDAGSATAVAGTESVVGLSYTVSGSLYAGYEAKNLLAVYLTAGTRKSDTTVAGITQNGYAGVANAVWTPLGPGSFDEPLTFKVKGNLIGATGFTAADGGNPLGFGIQGQADYYLDDDVFLSPVAAFDGRIDDTWSPDHITRAGVNPFDWKAGGGLIWGLSQKQWANAAYREVPDQGSSAPNLENAKVQKFTYLQVAADYARARRADASHDVNLVVRAEEPDGSLGLDENLGAMAEVRVSRVTQANPGTPRVWSTIGRISYDLRSHTLTPYAHWYFNSDQVAKLRLGVQVAPIKGLALEATYMSPNLNPAGGTVDQGKIELLIGMGTDPNFRMLKNMSFDYEGNEQE